MSNLDAALAYLARGWAVFPIGPPPRGQKRHGKPLVAWTKLQSRLPTEKEVRAWWKQWPDAGIGLVCGRVSGVVAVDVDPRHQGTEEGLPKTGAVQATPQGGAHYLYAYPKGAKEVRPQVNLEDAPMPWRGRDVRADGSYIQLQPTRHWCGKEYKWREIDGPLADPPPFALKKWEAPKPEAGGERSTWLTDLIEGGTRPGRRNDDLARFGGYLASKDIPEDVAISLAQSWMAKQGAPLHADEVETTIRSVYKTERRKNPKKAQRKEDSRAETKMQLMGLNAFMLEYGDHEVEWTVDGWLPKSTIAFIVSPPGGFKTWLTFDLATSIASGKPFLGEFPVLDRGPVLIFQQEDFNTQTAQRNALIQLNRLGLKPPALDGDYLLDVPVMPTDRECPVYFHPDRLLRFDDPRRMDELEELIKALRPVAIIADPFYRLVSTEDHMVKAAQDMDRLKYFRDEYGTSSIMVHHTTKGAEWGREGLWGSQFLNAFTETQWQIRRREGEDYNVIQRYFKVDGSQTFKRVDFSINAEKYKYRATAQDVSKDEAEELVKPNGKSGGKDEPTVYPKSLPKQITEYLATDGPCTLAELSLAVGSSNDAVARALKRLVTKGDVMEDEQGCWTHAVPSLT